MKYIAKKYEPSLLGRSVQEVGNVEMLRGVLDDTHLILGKHWMKGGERTESDLYCETRGQLLADFVGTKTFACGDNLTYIDFSMFEVLD